MTVEQSRIDCLESCAYPKSEVQAMAQIILSVIKYPDGFETLDWQIARELASKGYRFELPELPRNKGKTTWVMRLRTLLRRAII